MNIDVGGKNYKKNEIISVSGEISDYHTLQSMQVNLYYIILQEKESAYIKSPVNGFLNILFPTNSSPCITPYFINELSYIIRSGDNIIQPIEKNNVIEWKNTYGINNAIALFIPENILGDFKEKLSQEKDRFPNGLLTKSNNRISLLINQILDLNQRRTHLNELRIQSLLIEAIVHQIEGLYAENLKHEVIINKNHYEKIILAQKIIEKDLSQNYKIAELSKLVGTNEQYLKKYFKQHFGKTIINYITERKMKYAKELLMTGEYRVSDVARITGYKHSTHFTTAFKKFFGFIPNSLRYTFLVANENTQQVINEIENFINII